MKKEKKEMNAIEVKYRAFFDELAQIEKVATLSFLESKGLDKEAVGKVPTGLLSSVKKGVTNLLDTTPRQQGQNLKAIYQKGRAAVPVAEGAAGPGLKGVWGGVKEVAGTDTGKALIGGGAGAAALGGAYALGQRRPAPYPRY
ncbi:MAG: hypothetical protein ACXAEU_14505 [Candidatus Hodarchaeales archaeon]